MLASFFVYIVLLMLIIVLLYMYCVTLKTKNKKTKSQLALYARGCFNKSRIVAGQDDLEFLGTASKEGRAVQSAADTRPPPSHALQQPELSHASSEWRTDPINIHMLDHMTHAQINSVQVRNYLEDMYSSLYSCNEVPCTVQAYIISRQEQFKKCVYICNTVTAIFIDGPFQQRQNIFHDKYFLTTTINMRVFDHVLYVMMLFYQPIRQSPDSTSVY